MLILTSIVVAENVSENVFEKVSENYPGTQITLSSSAPNDWPMFHRTVDSNGYTPENGPNTATLLWTKSLQANVKTSPAVVDGRLYTYSFKGGQRSFYCLDAETGTTLWTFNVPSGSVCTAPAVADNKVYVGTIWGAGDFYCLDANSGSLIWHCGG
jgi:outer membrane protein assembly factor BamB